MDWEEWTLGSAGLSPEELDVLLLSLCGLREILLREEALVMYGGVRRASERGMECPHARGFARRFVEGGSWEDVGRLVGIAAKALRHGGVGAGGEEDWRPGREKGPPQPEVGLGVQEGWKGGGHKEGAASGMGGGEAQDGP